MSEDNEGASSNVPNWLFSSYLSLIMHYLRTNTRTPCIHDAYGELHPTPSPRTTAAVASTLNHVAPPMLGPDTYSRHFAHCTCTPHIACMRIRASARCQLARSVRRRVSGVYVATRRSRFSQRIFSYSRLFSVGLRVALGPAWHRASVTMVCIRIPICVSRSLLVVL